MPTPARILPLLALLLLGSLECAPRRAPLSVLLVTIDTLRHDRLGYAGWGAAETPTLDGLARRSAVFLQAVAPTPLTLPSHASLHLGIPPTRHGVLDNPPFAVPEEAGPTLAERLRALGLRTAAVIGAQPLRSGCGLERGFERYDDALPPASSGTVTLAERTADEVTDAALEALRAFGDEPFFLWIHYFDPHAPYAPPEEYRRRNPDPYDGEIAFVDHELGRLLDAVDLEHTLVLVTSDHGEGLGEHGEDAHGFLLHEATIRVPLVVHDPLGPVGARVDRQVRLVDLADWIVARAGGERTPCDRALTAPAVRGEPALLLSAYGSLHCGWAQLRGLRFPDGWKYLESCDERLFFLPEDLSENSDRSAQEPDLLARARRLLAERLRAPPPEPRFSGGSIPGYLSSAPPSDSVFPSREENCASPSLFDRGEVLRALQDGVRLLEAGLPSAAARELARAARIDPHNPAARFWLARAHLRRASGGEGREALLAARDELLATLRLRPRHEKAEALLLYVRTQLGEWDEAVNLARAIGARPGATPRALEAAAILHLTKKTPFGGTENPFFDPPTAVQLLERALESGDDERIRRRLEEAKRLAAP